MIAAPAAPAIDHTHDTAIESWVSSANGHADFPLQNLPFGVFSIPENHVEPRGGIRIGDEVLDLRALAESGLLSGLAQHGAQAASREHLNSFFDLGAGPRRELRQRVHALLARGARDRDVVAQLLNPVQSVTMHMPASVGDYTDFYVGINHAITVGSIYRPQNPLLPNYKWIPIGYHGRASSIRISGQPFRRPNGQVKGRKESAPTYEPARKLDFELELGVWIGTGNETGNAVPMTDAPAHVAGFCLLNDWSARDIQSWEYQPLGPFLAKSFATTISAWVVTPEALAPYRIERTVRPEGDPAPLPYLDDAADGAAGGLDVALEVAIATAQMRENGMPPFVLSSSSTRYMYWTIAQMIAHHTSGGCDLRPGDLLGTGTLSAPGRDGAGSLLEITSDGSQAVTLPSGETRTFLEDGDEIFLRARAHRDGVAPIGFGECRAVVLPAHTNAGTSNP